MKMIKFIQNFKMRKKLAIIYIVCVLLPMIFTDSLMLYAVRRNALKQQAINMNNVMQRVSYTITSDVTGAVDIITNLDSNKSLYDFMGKNYNSQIEYFLNFRGLFQNNMLKFYQNAHNIDRIMFYIDNPTIINGGSFYRLETVQDEYWYKQYLDKTPSLYICTYTDLKQNYYSLSRVCRTISLIKKLNYYNKTSDTNNIIKVDLLYQQMQQMILKEKIDGKLYICDDKYILFSNQPSEASEKAFILKHTIDLDDAAYQSTFRVASADWTIYIIPDPIRIGDLLKQTKFLILGLVIINLVLPTVIILLISKSFSKRLRLMEGHLYKVGNEVFESIEGDFGKDEIGDLIRSYNIMVLKIKELIEVVVKKNAEKQTLELAKKEAELKALQGQVNPHFMFNTLESIRMRSLLKNETETAKVIEQLALILRKSISWNEDNITIQEEMLFVKQYVAIQEYRFGNKLTFSEYIMPGCELLKVPKLSILTFVENACVHGLEGSSEMGMVSVAISKDEKNLYIEISDSGCGIDAKKIHELKNILKGLEIKKLSQSKSTGMLNALIRMNLYCEGTLQFDVDSEINEGTDITLQMPLDKMGKQEVEV